MQNQPSQVGQKPGWQIHQGYADQKVKENHGKNDYLKYPQHSKG